MAAETFEMECNCKKCGKDTLHLIESAGHECDSSNDIETCLECGWWMSGWNRNHMNSPDADFVPGSRLAGRAPAAKAEPVPNRRRAPPAPEELDALCHGLEIEEISAIGRHLDEYTRKWFGFSAEMKAKRTPEWTAAAARRLDGKTEPCCECGDRYPAAELHLGGEIYFKKCLVEEAERKAKRDGR